MTDDVYFEAERQRPPHRSEIFDAAPFTDLKWLGVDLDKTLAHGVFPEPGIGPPIWENVRKVEELLAAEDLVVVLWTARPWDQHEMIEDWFDHWGLSFKPRRIFCGKPLYRAFLDDKAISAHEPDYVEALRQLEAQNGD